MIAETKPAAERSVCVILARAGSKGLADKNIAELGGRPLIAWTIDHARAARGLDKIVVSTDGEAIAEVARRMGVEVIERPGELASDTATVDAAARHAVAALEARGERYGVVVILYANIPLRPADLIDRAIEKLAATGCDSVQSVCAVGKMHPLWMKRLGGASGDVLEHYEANSVYRRQDLPPVYMLDGGIIAVRREGLFVVREGEPHAFLGVDRRAVVTGSGEVVDVDAALDLAVAREIWRQKVGEVGKGGEHGREAMRIGGRAIGAGERAYVIAELGVNHDGSLERALELTRSAAAAGADAVKLQLFDARMLLSSEAELAAYQEATASDPVAMLDALQLPAEKMGAVRELAHELGLGFIVTCFSVELVEALRALEVDAVKVASPDAVNVPLVEAVRGLGKPLIISTGAAEYQELAAVSWLWRGWPTALMHCVSAYPAPEGCAAIGAMGALRELGADAVGYSDHTTKISTGMLAVAAGARLIEKHLTYDRAAAGPDHAASFDGEQFAEYVRLIREAEAELGEGSKRVLGCEADVRRVARQSVCAVRDLRAGQVIGREDVTVKRPGTGIAAAKLGAVIGRSLKRDVRANGLLHEGDVDFQGGSQSMRG